MEQLTLRGFEPELEARLRELARQRSLSLNRAALVLMRRGAGLAAPNDPPSERAPIGTALDRFVGVWSRNEEREFLRSIQDVEKIDPELWD